MRGLKPVAFIVLFTFVAESSFSRASGEAAVFRGSLSHVTDVRPAARAAFLAVRLVLLVTASQLLTLTTSAISLTDGTGER